MASRAAAAARIARAVPRLAAARLAQPRQLLHWSPAVASNVQQRATVLTMRRYSQDAKADEKITRKEETTTEKSDERPEEKRHEKAEEEAKVTEETKSGGEQGAKEEAKDGNAKEEDVGNEEAQAEKEELSPGMRLKKEVSDLQAEVKATKHKLLLALADFENDKKKLKRDRESRKRYATTSFARRMVEVYAKFDGAFPDSGNAAVAEDGPKKNLQEGVVLTRQAFLSTLERFDVTRVPFEVGETFVSSRHENVGSIDCPGDCKPDTLGKEIEGGWMLKPFNKGQQPTVLFKSKVQVFSSGPATPPPP